jgi:hypothetical protein
MSSLTGGRATSELQLVLFPVDLRVVFPEPIVTNDDITLPSVRDCKWENFGMVLDHDAEANYMRDLSSVVEHPVGVVYRDRQGEGFSLHAPFFHQVFVDKPACGSTVD